MAQPLLGAFRYRVFALLWIATIVSNIGGWMYSAAAGWLMTSLTKDAFLVSLVQVASSLPLFLLALAAGALSDTVDKRRLLIWGESVTAILSGVFAAYVWFNWVTPSSLLWFLFLISVCGALTSPAWQAVVPSLVPKESLPSAISANSVGFNVSRTVGPALAGAIIGPLGIASPFVFNAVSNCGVIGVLAGWREPKATADTLPPERFGNAIGVGLRYALHNAALRKTFVRTVAFFLFASSYWALLPLVARLRVSGGPAIYGYLLGAIGLGAVGAAFVMPRWKKRVGADGLVAIASVGTAIALVLFGIAREPVIALTASIVAGAAWIFAVATLNVSAQLALPDWVRGRGLAMYMTVMFGALTLGSALWGQLATVTSLQTSLFVSAAAMLAVIPLNVALETQDRRTNRPYPVDAVAGAGRIALDRRSGWTGPRDDRISPRPRRRPPGVPLGHVRGSTRTATGRRQLVGYLRRHRAIGPVFGNVPRGLVDGASAPASARDARRLRAARARNPVAPRGTPNYSLHRSEGLSHERA